jgi:hypothetical protein
MSKATNITTVDLGFKSLYLAGGMAAIVAGLVFRRNLGPEASIITARTPPAAAIDWFTLLQDNRLLGLTFLNIFDIVDYALVGLMFLALYYALRRYNKSYMALASALGFMGIAVYFASNTALSVLSLSDQYAAATSDAQRSMFLAAGQAIMAINPPGVIYPGTGNYLSFLLVAAAGLIISLVMLQSAVFSKATAYIGVLASAFDLACCIAIAYRPVISDICIFLIAAAGLLLMIWHILIGLRLIRLGRGAPAEAEKTGSINMEASYG